MSTPAMSRRALFGAGARRALDARLGEVTPPSRTARGRRRVDNRPARLSGDLLPVAELMVELAGIAEGQPVLTVAVADDALTAVTARRGAAVTSSEVVSPEWPDQSFEAVLGSFAATSHPDPRSMADALKRVARSGAPIVLASWPDRPWGRYETAYRHFFDFPELDVQEHELRESSIRYSLVFCRRP